MSFAAEGSEVELTMKKSRGVWFLYPALLEALYFLNQNK